MKPIYWNPGQKCCTFRYRRKSWYVPYTEAEEFIYLHTIIEAK
jgi:hypothetical protein